ncbi:MAG: energy transducer TonB [Chitinophagaceae bacterium]
MKFSRLSFKLRGIATALALTTFMVACNDNTDTANNSTSANPDSAANSAVPGASNTPAAPTMAVKKKGKATASLKADDQTVKMSKDKMGYYNWAEVSPAYNGSLDDYINNHIEYPQEAIDNSAEGTVYVQFGVDENGKVTNVTTTGKKIGYGLEEEAIKVVSDMPKWTPGQVKGKTVKTWRTLPIVYKIES